MATDPDSEVMGMARWRFTGELDLDAVVPDDAMDQILAALGDLGEARLSGRRLAVTLEIKALTREGAYGRGVDRVYAVVERSARWSSMRWRGGRVDKVDS
jgi:hypothetical protein